jgi:nucleoside 2-deoxyribosyltransferase
MGVYEVREIYIAAPFASKAEAQDIRVKLERQGWTVTSNWLDTPYGVEECRPEVLREEAFRDLTDIHRASDFLLLNWPGSQGGMLVELGFAMARGKRIWVMGPLSNVFLHLPDLKRVEHIGEVLP